MINVKHLYKEKENFTIDKIYEVVSEDQKDKIILNDDKDAMLNDKDKLAVLTITNGSGSISLVVSCKEEK